MKARTRPVVIQAPEVETLSTGIKARIVPVPAYLIDKMVSKIKDPRPPKQYIDAKGREEENPFDPTYLAEIEEAKRLRGVVTLEALIVFGVRLEDPVPDDGLWLDNLRWLERRGHLDLSEYDLQDPTDREFVYKAFVAVAGLDLMKITMRSGLTSQEVAVAMDSFRSSEVRATDQDRNPPAPPTDRSNGGS